MTTQDVVIFLVNYFWNVPHIDMMITFGAQVLARQCTCRVVSRDSAARLSPSLGHRPPLALSSQCTVLWHAPHSPTATRDSPSRAVFVDQVRRVRQTQGETERDPTRGRRSLSSADLPAAALRLQLQQQRETRRLAPLVCC